MENGIGKAVAAARKLQGLSQERLAAKAGVSSKTVSRLEAGKGSNFRGDSVERIGKALGLSLALTATDAAPPAAAPAEPDPALEPRVVPVAESA